MRRGGKPTPTHLKTVRGNPGGRPLNKNEPVPSGALGNAPADWTESQRKLWDEIVDAAPQGVLTGSDRHLVELAVRNLAQLRAATNVSPQHSAELRRCLGEMGMTPSERTRIAVHKPDVANPFKDL